MVDVYRDQPCSAENHAGDGGHHVGPGMLPLQNQDPQDPLLPPTTVRVRLRQGGVRQGQGAGFGDLRRHGPRLQAPLQGRTFRNQNRDCAPAAAEKGSTTTTTTNGACCCRGEPPTARSNEQQARSATNVHKSAHPVPMPVPVSVPAPVPKSTAALLPLPLLQAAAMPDTTTTTTTALSDTTTAMSATCVRVQVPSMDAVPVPRPPVGRLLRGEPTTRRPLRCHVTANCCCRGGRAGTAAGCCNCNLSRPCHFICMCASA